MSMATCSYDGNSSHEFQFIMDSRQKEINQYYVFQMVINSSIPKGKQANATSKRSRTQER